MWVTNVPDYCVEEVSDHAVGMVLAWTRGLAVSDREVRAGRWDPAGARLRRLSTLTCGVVGYGRIGRATVRKLGAFGCRILAHDPRPPKDAPGVEMVGLEELLRRSDVVILHVPLTSDTHHIIGAEQLELMSPGGLLVNVSRGGLVDTDAVVKALDSGHLDGAAFDVLETEPHVPAGLLDQPGALLTPHIAFSSDASVTELRRRAAEEVVRILAGEAPAHACNSPSVRPPGRVTGDEPDLSTGEPGPRTRHRAGRLPDRPRTRRTRRSRTLVAPDRRCLVRSVASGPAGTFPLRQTRLGQVEGRRRLAGTGVAQRLRMGVDAVRVPAPP